jgi:hypothetical protein
MKEMMIIFVRMLTFFNHAKKMHFLLEVRIESEREREKERKREKEREREKIYFSHLNKSY